MKTGWDEGTRFLKPVPKRKWSLESGIREGDFERVFPSTHRWLAVGVSERRDLCGESAQNRIMTGLGSAAVFDRIGTGMRKCRF
jgi:hypothetical protein